MTYVGAGSRLDPTTGLGLPWREWAYQPKIDGQYVTATTDIEGRLVSAVSRSGASLDLADLAGIVAGPPLATLVGELEAHTEAGIRVAATRGWRNLHLFDCTRSEGHSLALAPYSARWSELQRAHTDIELRGAGRIAPTQPDPKTWTWDRQLPPPARSCFCARRTCRCCMRRCKRACCVTPPPKPRLWSSRRIPGGPPRDLRRVPIVPLLRGPDAGRKLWADFVHRGGGEGVVAVRLDAPVGVRGAKRKVKDSDTIDCRVIRIEARHAELAYGGQTFVVSAQGKVRPRVGQLVAVAMDGWYESGCTPRFARMVRVRDDLEAQPSA